MSKTTIFIGLTIVYCSALLLLMPNKDTEIREAIENRSPSYTTIEVKPTKNYEDHLQMTADARVVKIQRTVSGYTLQDAR